MRKVIGVFCFGILLGASPAAFADGPPALGDLDAAFMYDLGTTAEATFTDGDVKDCVTSGLSFVLTKCDVENAMLVWTGPTGIAETVPMTQLRYYKPVEVPWSEYTFSGSLTKSVNGIELKTDVLFRVVIGIEGNAQYHGDLTLAAVGTKHGLLAVPKP